MSVLLRTIEAFPRGRTTEQIFVLTGAAFDHTKRISVLAELDELARAGRIAKGRDGKWYATKSYIDSGVRAGRIPSAPKDTLMRDVLIAAPAHFKKYPQANPHEEQAETNANVSTIDPHALLRYWRSALRSDPRGSTVGRDDLHGVDWHLFSGRGPIVPEPDGELQISIELESLQPEFRKALLRREGEDNSFAVGWPLAAGRRAGVPVVWPVGMLSASWSKSATHLEFRIEADDVLVNPEWISDAARMIGWQKSELTNILASDDGIGLHAEEFLARLREAAAGHFRSRITGETLGSQLDLNLQGICDLAALFLPNESSFTAQASHDLDVIATWPPERLARSALAPVLGFRPDMETSPAPVVNFGPLNAEQFKAVRNACTAPLSVVTGPPGTGKSQAIVSMAASILLQGGSVLVASKTHQALDAVEDRLGGIAADVPFITRTLDPYREIDTSFDNALNAIVAGTSGAGGLPPDGVIKVELETLACKQQISLQALEERAEIECEIAEILDRLEARARSVASTFAQQKREIQSETSSPKLFSWQRLLSWLQPFSRRREERTASPLRNEGFDPSKARSSELEGHLERLRDRKAKLPEIDNLMTLASEIESLAKSILPSVMRARVRVEEADRLSLAEAKDDREFAGGKGPMESDLARAILRYRPLWLASVLGTGKRVPLVDGLFDLVIFDEASRCDIASAIPLFARAKRAVIVGDDRQLAFIPQLGQAQDRNLMQAQGLPVSRMSRFAQSQRSLFDFALRVPDVLRVTLRHQYRSAGAIVDYLSRSFYGGELIVAQALDGVKVPKGGKPGLAWTDVAAPMTSTAGHVNRPEIDAIMSELSELLEKQGYEGMIGVISPFRAQVQALHEAAWSKLPAALLKKADFRVGTVDGFQGQERDLILFSTTVGPGSSASALTFFQRDSRRLNVAISRARAVAHVFGDLSFARSGRLKALASLAAFATEPRRRVGEGVFDSVWERRVYHALKARGLDPHPQHEIAGRYLDFALFGKTGVKLDLEVDGRRWHQTADGRRKSADLWRDEQMKALGWQVRRFWVDELSQSMEACLDLVEQDLS